VKRSGIALAILSLAIGIAACAGTAPRGATASVAPPAPPVATTPRASVVHDVLPELAGASDLHVDLHLPIPGDKPAPWMVFAHERGWPAPDDKERTGAALADALQRRGIAVAVLSFGISDAHPFHAQVDVVAGAVKELARRAHDYGLVAEPVLAGEELGATLVARLALDPRFGFGPRALRGVIAMNGVYDDASSPRADAPPFMVLSAHGDSPASAQSSRALVRSLERAGAKQVHGYHASGRDAHSLTNLSGEHNDVGDLVAAFVRGEPTPGGAEGAWALRDTWSANAPISTESFWKDERLVVRRPADARFRATLRNIFGEMMRDLEPWPLATYEAIDLADYLRAHPELGSGEWVAMTNARGEKVVLRRSEIERQKPVIVVGVDDDRNMFRLFVTYNVHRAYSWKPETEPRPLMVRHVGAFLYQARAETDGKAASFHVTTLADTALTASSFRVTEKDPLAIARSVPKALGAALTNEQGCLQCHSLRGDGARAHHLRASDGKLAEAQGLPFEEYPRDVLRRFLFEQEAVAKSFGVSPLIVSATVANQLLAEVAK
jgi:hypothetical protein